MEEEGLRWLSSLLYPQSWKKSVAAKGGKIGCRFSQTYAWMGKVKKETCA
ncbi:MAG: hypothetical protein JRI87_05565 [Deltaproteobacteria bacterium]|nr:hypothetical protein [Deltaproteobacteria bacterium]